MAMSHPRQWRPRTWVLTFLALIAVVVASVPTAEALGPAAARNQLRPAMIELGVLAGARDRHGEVAISRPIPVGIAQEGGDMWMQTALRSAVDDDPVFVFDAHGDNFLKVEVVDRGRFVGMRVQLFRKGWYLRNETDDRMWLWPQLAMLAGALGLGAAMIRRRLWVGAVVAGVTGQLLALAIGDPSATPWGPMEQWANGPLGRSVAVLARRVPDDAASWAPYLVVLCVVIVVVDHVFSRNSKRNVGWGGFAAYGLLAPMGLLAYAEAAARLGALGALAHPAVAMAAACLVVGWALGVWSLRRA